MTLTRRDRQNLMELRVATINSKYDKETKCYYLQNGWFIQFINDNGTMNYLFRNKSGNTIFEETNYFLLLEKVANFGYK